MKNKTKVFSFTTSTQDCTGGLARAVRQVNELQVIQTESEVKLSLLQMMYSYRKAYEIHLKTIGTNKQIHQGCMTQINI